ncbi:IS66 family transposase [Mangrovicoccus algicola]|uniref:Transposase n=1 Tax=Mangrovicoccus algicola TaxID=2771008 RepID=A0A8J6YZD7_9RHOB|nr:transposase [Mangrovicoccus algicola]
MRAAPIDALFDIEREIDDMPADERLAARRDRARPLVTGLHNWPASERGRMSRRAPVSQATRAAS